MVVVDKKVIGSVHVRDAAPPEGLHYARIAVGLADPLQLGLHQAYQEQAYEADEEMASIRSLRER